MKVCSLCRRCYDDIYPYCGVEGHPPLSETRSGHTEMVAGYKLEALLKSNARGQTYRASEIDSCQPCLIKILPADTVNGEGFLRDARIAAAFFHPNVVDVYEASTLDSGELYVVSENPEGQTLRELLGTAGTPKLLMTILVARQAAEAVHALHLKGLVHGLINPENIILTNDGECGLLARVRDIDFGGVVARSVVSTKFLIDSALDLLRYFAPEVCNGEAATMKADVYSLGVILYEMLSGTPPFDATKAAGIIEMHRNQPPPEIKINNFDLRMLLTHTLTESLQKQSRLRQSSANTFARQMRHIEQLATHVSTPPPAGATPPVPVKSASLINVAPPPTKKIVVDTLAVTIPEKPVLTPKIAAEAAAINMSDMESDLPEISEAFMENPVREKQIENGEPTPAPVFQRSRLKIHRKRFQRNQEQHPSIAPEIDLPPPAGPDPVEPMPVETAHAQILPASPEPEKIEPAAPHMAANKIEWTTPDDDIPSVEDVLAALAEPEADRGPREGVPSGVEVATGVFLTSDLDVQTAIPSEPEPVGVWDLPVLVNAPVQEPQEKVEVEAKAKAAVASSTKETAPVSQAQSDALANEVRSILGPDIEQLSVSNVSENSPSTTINEQQTTIDSSISGPHVSKSSPLESQIVATPEAAKSQRSVTTHVASPPPATRPKRKRKTKPNREPVVLADDTEEITIVTALRESNNNRGIRIHLSDPKARRRPAPVRQVVPLAASEVPFSLTLLGGDTDRRPSMDFERNDAFLSLYSSFSEIPSSVVRRSVTIGGGLVALIALLFFGGQILKLDVLADKDGQSKTVATTQQSLPPTTQANPVSDKRPAVKNFMPAAPDTSSADRPGSSTVGKSSPPVFTKSQDSEPKATPQNQSQKSTTRAQNARNTPPVSSTLVITSKNGKVQTTVEPQKRSSNKQPQSAPSKPAGLTRPRIVANPKS
jgi:serine/threonine protein kinase